MPDYQTGVVIREDVEVLFYEIGQASRVISRVFESRQHPLISHSTECDAHFFNVVSYSLYPLTIIKAYLF